MFLILELANNHMGSVERAKAIIDAHAEVLKNHPGLTVGFKLQFRDLDTLIHPDFKSSDLKHIKRFRETALSHEDFAEIVAHIKSCGFLAVATPFDENSVALLKKLHVDVAKIASCSIDDWPLLAEISRLGTMVVASTAGADKKTLKRVASMFGNRHRQHGFAFMHCVGEYPTPIEDANLNRIDMLRGLLGGSSSYAQVGISTHEAPDQESVVPLAVAKGCTIIEKHVDILTEGHTPNAYSCMPHHIDAMLEQVALVTKMLKGTAPKEHESLRSLKRGVYAVRDIPANERIMSTDSFYLALPCQDGQLDASGLEELVGSDAPHAVKAHSAVPAHWCQSIRDREEISRVLVDAVRILDRAGLSYSPDDDVELSTHYGLMNFMKHGALIINRVNREYCKKLIVMLPGQAHPPHHHIKKEEAFELLYGDCKLVLDGVVQQLERGKPIVIARGAVHSFSSDDGCVIEEISTTHLAGDSVYSDPSIVKLRLADRKFKTKFWRHSPR